MWVSLVSVSLAQKATSFAASGLSLTVLDGFIGSAVLTLLGSKCLTFSFWTAYPKLAEDRWWGRGSGILPP